MSRYEQASMTESRAINAAEMIQLACTSTDPIRRAQILAETQPQLAWALRSAIEECLAAEQTWAQIGQAVGVPRETVFRQFTAGGPIVTTRAVQSAKSPNLNSYAADAIYAFQTEDGTWYGSPDALPSDQFTTAMLHFDPADPQTNHFAGQVLRVRFGPYQGDISFNSAQVCTANGTVLRVRVTHEVVDLLFANGQTPLRRALTALVHATTGNPGVDPAFREVVDRAAHAQTKSVSNADAPVTTAEFVTAVQTVIDSAPPKLDVHVAMTLKRLEKVVAGYQAWSAATQPTRSE
jgi:hypothetical protein